MFAFQHVAISFLHIGYAECIPSELEQLGGRVQAVRGLKIVKNKFFELEKLIFGKAI
jgi:hypothetical protein